MDTTRPLPTSVSVVVVGAGQAGLAAAWYLRHAGLDFLVLDAAEGPGASWRTCWDSLRLFTPARFCTLPGMPFPGDPDHYPGKDEVPDYFGAYIEKFDLPVRFGHRVTALRHDEGGKGFLVGTDTTPIRARQVVVAVGAYHQPHIPYLARRLDADLFTVHSSDYRNPGQVPCGTVLVVGAGNSGVQIADELADTHTVLLSQGAPCPRLPRSVLGRDIFWWLDRTGVIRLPLRTSFGRRFGTRDPLFGVDPGQLAREGRVRLVARATDGEGKEIVLADKARVKPDAVVWATGYRTDWTWLAPELRGPGAQPRHRAGVAEPPGLYFLGLRRQRSRGSALLGFVKHDAEHITRTMLERA